jgi:hypothetical protein
VNIFSERKKKSNFSQTKKLKISRKICSPHADCRLSGFSGCMRNGLQRVLQCRYLESKLVGRGWSWNRTVMKGSNPIINQFHRKKMEGMAHAGRARVRQSLNLCKWLFLHTIFLYVSSQAFLSQSRLSTHNCVDQRDWMRVEEGNELDFYSRRRPAANNFVDFSDWKIT